MQRLLLFARRPRLGLVKTRLVPPLTAKEAVTVYRAFLMDQISFLTSFSGMARLELWLDGSPAPEDGLRPLPPSLKVFVQGPGGFGARLRRAFRGSDARDGGPSVLIGADSPTLPARLVRGAFRRLSDGADAVVAPAVDGGYVLLGANTAPDPLFDGVPWGTSAVLEVTCRRAAEAGISLEILESWFDVDDDRGLARLRTELAAPDDARRAPATLRALDALARSRPGVI
jgi:rSAM/selenodomain-associated transferase 1